jgi:6-phosphogluconolactonase
MSERPPENRDETTAAAQGEPAKDPAAEIGAANSEGTAAESSTGDAPTGASTEAAPPWLPSPPQIYRFKDPAALAESAAKRFLDSAKRAVQKNDRFLVVLAGGSTPRQLYQRLVQEPYRAAVPWKRTYFVFGDERCVPPDDEASNYRMAQETLFDPLEIPDHRVLRMKGEQVPADAARRYRVRLNDLFLGLPRRHFDLVLLGIGTDGHTASLFPGTQALEETEHWVAANEVPQLGAWRLTLTYPALNSARRVIFLATGESKAQVIAEAFGGLDHPRPHPCELVAPLHARREVLVDVEAAARIPKQDAQDERGRDGDDPESGTD